MDLFIFCYVREIDFDKRYQGGRLSFDRDVRPVLAELPRDSDLAFSPLVRGSSPTPTCRPHGPRQSSSTETAWNLSGLPRENLNGVLVRFGGVTQHAQDAISVGIVQQRISILLQNTSLTD